MAKIHKKKSALKRSTGRAVLGCVLDGALMAALAAGIVWHFDRLRDWLRNNAELWGVPARILLPVAAVLLLALLIVRMRRNARSAAIRRAGVRGEDMALKQLQKALPGNYHLFSNVVVDYDGGRSETDLIVVGPGGVTVVEVKNYSGEVQGRAESARLTHVKNSGSESIYNPLRQVATHVHRVSGYLRQNHQGVWVRSAVFFVNPKLRVNISGRSETPWFTPERLDELAMMLRAGHPQLSARQVEGIVEALKRA